MNHSAGRQINLSVGGRTILSTGGRMNLSAGRRLLLSASKLLQHSSLGLNYDCHIVDRMWSIEKGVGIRANADDVTLVISFPH